MWLYSWISNTSLPSRVIPAAASVIFLGSHAFVGSAHAASAGIEPCERRFELYRIEQPEEFVVGNDDVRRGYVTVRARARVLAPDAYQLRYAIARGASYVRDVSMASYEAPIGRHAAGCATVRDILITYRLDLDARAAPGRYPWPILLALEARESTSRPVASRQ
jgi:hypothetical protein